MSKQGQKNRLMNLYKEIASVQEKSNIPLLISIHKCVFSVSNFPILLQNNCICSALYFYSTACFAFCFIAAWLELFQVRIRQSEVKGYYTWIKQKFSLKWCDISISTGMKTLWYPWSVYVKLSQAVRYCDVWCSAEGLSQSASWWLDGQTSEIPLNTAVNNMQTHLRQHTGVYGMPKEWNTTQHDVLDASVLTANTQYHGQIRSHISEVLAIKHRYINID